VIFHGDESHGRNQANKQKNKENKSKKKHIYNTLIVAQFVYSHENLLLILENYSTHWVFAGGSLQKKSRPPKALGFKICKSLPNSWIS